MFMFNIISAQIVINFRTNGDVNILLYFQTKIGKFE